MTIREAIDRADALRPGPYKQEEKIAWLSELDGLIYKEIVQTHEGAREWHPYTPETDGCTQLLAEFPYDGIYIHWLIMKNDYYNGDVARYNNAAAVFNAEYGEYKNYYNRTHMPLGTKLCYYGRPAGGNSGALVGRAGEEIADPLTD